MMFRQNHPSSREPHLYKDHVVASLERGGFDRETTLVLGGSALALMGIRPANDVDIMVPGATFNQLEHRRLTPGGLIVQPKKFTDRPFLEAYTTREFLDLDITRPDDLATGEEDPVLDTDFLKQIEQFDAVEGYRHAPLGLIIAHKEEVGRRKDRKDIRLIESHLTKSAR